MTYAPTSAGSPNIEVGPKWQRPDAELLAQFQRHSVANIGDALGRLGMPDGGIAPLWDGCRAVGSALTVLTVAGDDLAVIDAVAHIESGDFLVINGFGYTGRAVMGDILAQYFSSRGAVRSDRRRSGQGPRRDPAAAIPRMVAFGHAGRAVEERPGSRRNARRHRRCRHQPR